MKTTLLILGFVLAFIVSSAGILAFGPCMVEEKHGAATVAFLIGSLGFASACYLLSEIKPEWFALEPSSY